ncbi:GNAT family N-acetyltransferase [Photobacterium alginatilyticum]|uniref:GNAT family N-acetyltransferase n=1 Tax=Photobacterium alginatilyticum TaxID=1775171 RepID=UPI004067E4E0
MRSTYRKVLMDEGFRDPVRIYLGLYDGEPVATACCYFEHDVVGIYWVSTLPAFRERGIGRRLMNIVLRDSYDAGYKFAILQASGEGFKMYKDIGFRQVCNNTRYEWKP